VPTCSGSNGYSPSGWGEKPSIILPRVQWDKGAALRYVREQLGLENSVCLCVGDDETDETMFAAAFEEDICVRVNPDGPSVPRFRLHDSTEVLALLEEVDALAARGQQLSRAGDPNTADIQANSRGA
jgi:trehalose-6-phosphatase